MYKKGFTGETLQANETAYTDFGARFLIWARDNYSGREYQEVVNQAVQSGDLPEAFWDSLEPVPVWF